MASTFQTKYPGDSTDLSMTGFGGLSSSSTFLAGWEFAAISNRTNLDFDHLLSGKIRVGTTPNVNSYIQVWVVPALKFASGTPTWPDVFDGTASAETWTAVAIRDAAARLAIAILVDTSTSSRDYYFGNISVAALFGGVLPPDYAVFVTQNTGANLDATDGNHQISYTRVQAQSA
jgi:hypothetical protein